MEYIVENVTLQVLWFYPFIIISPKLFVYCWHYIILAVDNVRKELKIQILFRLFNAKYPCWYSK